MYIVFNFLKIFKLISINAAGDVKIRANGSSITFLSTGDVLVQAKRHIIRERDLSFDNCPREMVQNAICMREISEEAYNEYIDKFVNVEEDGGQLSTNQLCNRDRGS